MPQFTVIFSVPNDEAQDCDMSIEMFAAEIQEQMYDHGGTSGNFLIVERKQDDAEFWAAWKKAHTV